MDKQEIINLVNELVSFGEDREELNYWLEIYDDLPEEKQNMLYVNLKQELETLKQS